MEPKFINIHDRDRDLERRSIVFRKMRVSTISRALPRRAGSRRCSSIWPVSLSINTLIIVLIKNIIIVNLFILQPTRCDTSQQQQIQPQQQQQQQQLVQQPVQPHLQLPLMQMQPQMIQHQQQQQQQIDTSRIKSTVRQLIKTTSNYLHNIKLANQQDKNSNIYQPGKFLLAGLNQDGNKQSLRNTFLLQNNTPNNQQQQLYASNVTTNQVQLPQQSASDQRLVAGDLSTSALLQTAPSQIIPEKQDPRASNQSQSHQSSNSTDGHPDDVNQSRRITGNPYNHRVSPNRSNNINSDQNENLNIDYNTDAKNKNKNNYTMNDIIQLAASNFITTSSDGKIMNLNPPYESMTKDVHDVQIAHSNNNNFPLSDTMEEVEIIGLSNQSNFNHNNNNRHYGTHANVSVSHNLLDYLSDPTGNRDQQVSSSDQRLDYENIIDGSEHLISESNNNDNTLRNGIVSNPSRQNHNGKRQYRMYDVTGGEEHQNYVRNNDSNNRTSYRSPILTSDTNHYKPLYLKTNRNKQSSSDVKPDYFEGARPSKSYRNSNYSHDNLPSETHQQPDSLVTTNQYDQTNALANEGEHNHTEQPLQVIDDDNANNGDHTIYPNNPTSEQSSGGMIESSQDKEESVHEDRISPQDPIQQTSNLLEDQEQVAQTQPTVGELPVVAPQLPIQYDSEIHMPPEGYYDDYYKPSMSNNNHHDNINNSEAIEESSKFPNSDNFLSSSRAPNLNSSSSNSSRSSHYNDNIHNSNNNNNFDISTYRRPSDGSEDQYKNHRYSNLRGIDSSNQGDNFHSAQPINSRLFHNNNSKHHKIHQQGRNDSGSMNNTGYQNQVIELDHRHPNIEYYRDHATMAAMSAADQHYRHQMRPTTEEQHEENHYNDDDDYKGGKKNHRKRNKQGFDNNDRVNPHDNHPRELSSGHHHQKPKYNRTNVEILNEEGPIVLGVRGVKLGTNESSLMPELDNERNDDLKDNYESSTIDSDNAKPERFHHESSHNVNEYNVPPKPNNLDQSSYEWSDSPKARTTDIPSANYDGSDAQSPSSGRRYFDKGNFSVIDYDGTGYRRPNKNADQTTKQYNNNHDNGEQHLKNLILSRPTNEPTVTSTIGTIKHLKEMKPQPDRNELMNELLTALDRVKVAIYKLQPLTAKVNAMYRKSVTSKTRDPIMDNNKGTYAKRYPPGEYDNSYNRIHPSEKIASSESVAKAVYVPAPIDIVEAYLNGTKTSKNTNTNNRTLDWNFSLTRPSIEPMPSEKNHISNRMLTNVEIHASESSENIPTIIATGLGRRLDDGQVSGELEVTDSTTSHNENFHLNRDNDLNHRSKLLKDSAAPDFVPEDRLKNNEPLFGYRITIYQSPEDYEVPTIKETNSEFSEEQNYNEEPDPVVDRRSGTESPDEEDYMATSESSIIEHEMQVDASEKKKKYESGGEGSEEAKESGKGGKKGGKKSGKAKKGESKKKKHHAETKKKKEYKKIKQNKGILSKEKKSMHRDKHIAAHDRGAAKEKALKERTQIEFFEREQIVDDEYEKGKKSLMKAGWQTGAESKKAIKVSAHTPEPKSYESKDGSKKGEHSSYEKGQENKMGRAKMHSSNKYEKKNMEHKGKKFKGWREKGYKIITETEFIDRGSLHDSAYKKRDRGAAHHKKYKKQESKSEGHHGTIEESSKKKSDKKEKKYDSKEHESKKHKHKESHKKKKKKKKKEFENEFEKDHDHEESVMAATVTPRGNHSETAYETTLKPVYRPYANQTITLSRLISNGHDENILNFVSDHTKNHRSNDTAIVVAQNIRSDNKPPVANVSVSFTGHGNPLPLDSQSRSILSSLQAILARQNSDIDIMDNSTGKHINKTKLGVYKLEDSHIVKLANLGNNGGNGSNNSAPIVQLGNNNNHSTTTTKQPRIDSNNQEMTTTAVPQLNTEIIPMNDSPVPVKFNARGNNHQGDAASLNPLKQQILSQGQHKQDLLSSSRKPEVNQQLEYSNTGKMNDRGPLGTLAQMNNNVQGGQQQVNRTPSVARPQMADPIKFTNQPGNNHHHDNLKMHQSELPTIFEQHHQAISPIHFEQNPIRPQQQTHFLNQQDLDSNRNNFPSRFISQAHNHQRQYQPMQPNNMQQHQPHHHHHQQQQHHLQVNQNIPETQLFAQLNDQLARSIRHGEATFGKSMAIQSYPQLSSALNENLPLIDYDQDHTPVFPSSGYYLSDAM